MKRFLLPIAVCAALAGCAEYGTVAYGNYPAYPAYSTSPYAYDYAYGPYGPVYGSPSVSLGFSGGYGDGHHHDHGRGWRGGEHRGSTGHWHGDGTHAMGSGPRHSGRGGPGARHGGGHHRAGPRHDHDGHQHR